MKCTGEKCPMPELTKGVTACTAHDCPHRTPPMTNADRIRAMSDEELADLFDAATDAPCITICGNYDRCKRNNAWEPICRNHHLAWLQQPAEEGDRPNCGADMRGVPQ